MKKNVVMALSLLLLISANAFSAEITVTSAADSGPGSLRQAVITTKPGDTIVISLAGKETKIILTGGEIPLEKNLNIKGPGADKLAIAGSDASRIFKIDDGSSATMSTVVIENMTITNGLAKGDNGGAIYNKENLTIKRCSIENSVALGTENNSGNGGAIYNLGTLTVKDTTISGNKASYREGKTSSGNGGGIYNGVTGDGIYHGIVSMVNCTISGNYAVGAEKNPMKISPSDIDKSKNGFGGGIFNDTRVTKEQVESGNIIGDNYLGVISINHTTIAFNTANFGGGLCNYVCVFDPGEDMGKLAGDIDMKNTIVSHNISTVDKPFSDIIGPIVANFSLAESINGMIVGYDNIEGQPAGLGELKNNGGTVKTHALLPGSPAIDSGSETSEIVADQTGAQRKIGGRIDMGAYEAPLQKVTASGGKPIAFTDIDGDKVNISLEGPGACDVYIYKERNSDTTFINLEGTTAESTLIIKTKDTTVKDINVAGSLGRIEADSASLAGNITVEGSLGYIGMADVKGPCTIDIKAASPNGIEMFFKDITDLAVNSKGGIKKFSAVSLKTGSNAINTIKTEWIGGIDIEGWLKNTTIKSTANIAEVKLGGIDRSRIYAGMSDDLIGMPMSAEDFAAPASIDKIKITGTSPNDEGYSAIDFIFAAATIGKVSIRGLKEKGDMPVCGVAAKSVQSLEYSLPGKEGIEKFDLSRGVSNRGNFYVQVYSVMPKRAGKAESGALPWSFAVLDDTRGGIFLKNGIATWNLGKLFDDISSRGIPIVFLPGDIVSGVVALYTYEFQIDEQYGQFFGEWNKTYKKVGKNVFPVRGNHECYFAKTPKIKREKWTKHFGKDLPQNGPSSNAVGVDENGFTYTYEYNNTFFVLVDQYAHNGKDIDIPYIGVTPSIFCMSGGSGNWLQDQMNNFSNNASLQHCFVFGHCPLYKTFTEGTLDDSKDQAEARDKFIETINEKVGVYFCGHDHFYDHVTVKNTKVPEGCQNISSLHQVLVGSGGADLDWGENYKNDNYNRLIHETKKMGYVLVTINGDIVKLQFMVFNVKHRRNKFEFDQVQEFDSIMDEWTYTFKKKTK